MLWRNDKKRKKLPKRTDELDEINVSDDELEEAVCEENPYYAKVASIYNAIRYLLFVALVLLISISSIRNSDSITYDNLMFLMKDFGSVADAVGGNFEDITYNPDTTLSVLGFRKNLAIASPSGLTIYAGDGKTTYEEKDKYSNPFLATSDRYLLLYDFGGYSFSLYNSFARIYTEDFEYEITGADISDSGMFALVTRTKEYNSSVLLYNKNCKLKNRYLSDNRVIDVSINSKGDRICILYFTVENSSFVTEIMISKPGTDKTVAKLFLNDVFPLACEYSDDGNLTVLCDKAIYFYNEDGNLLGSYDIDGDIESAKLSEDGSVLCVPSKSITKGSFVIVFGTTGKQIYNNFFEENIIDAVYEDGYLFLLSGNLLKRINIKTSDVVEKEIFESGKNIIAYSKNDTMVCSSSKARYYDFDN